MNEDKLFFASDYQEGMCEEILERLQETNRTPVSGYGSDVYSERAKAKIREAMEAEDAEVYFLAGGTQTNAVAIAAALKGYEGVIAADTGHIALHEAGAIEASGHKVLTVKGEYGKMKPEDLRAFLQAFFADENHEHMVFPGLVYLSHPSEYGTLYSRAELEAIRTVCDEYKIGLYVDGARLAYALAAKENDVSLPDLARLADMFYIGGTKCGAMLGEALVVTAKYRIPNLFTTIKQKGALLAKGRMVGISFETLFTGGLYEQIAKRALKNADVLRSALSSMGWTLVCKNPTNQIFTVIDNDSYEKLKEKVVFSYWEPYDKNHTVIRFATSWATDERDVEALIAILKEL